MNECTEWNIELMNEILFNESAMLHFIEWMNAWMNERLNEWNIEWMNEWMIEWMNEWLNKLINKYSGTSL